MAQSTVTPRPSPRVIIIGGAITGLTLARCLEKAGIDYVLLERHSDILTNLGGTLALLPAGCRVLDQLGVFDLLEECRSDLRGLVTALPDGYVYRKETFGLFGPKLGYPLTLLRRRDLLHALYSSVEDRSKIQLGAKVVDIAPQGEPDGPLRVTTDSGEVYTGDIVVGADGVHGVVREHMWRIAELQQTPKGKTSQVRTGTKKGAMTVDYYTILGATPAAECPRGLTEMVRPGDMHMRCDRGVLLTLIANLDGSVNWFAAFKMDQTRVHPDLPEKLSQEEIRAKLEDYAQWKAWDGADSSDITFGDLWRVSPWVSATHLQEGFFDTWSCGRMTCIGDTVFKFTPNLAQGANLCIESAAALANALYRIKSSGNTTTTAIHEALTEYPKPLKSRIKQLCLISYHTTRVHLLESRLLWYVARYILPYVMEPWVQYGVFLREHGMAVMLDYLPRPDRDKRAAEERAKGWRMWRAVGHTALMVLGIGALSWFLR